MVNNNSPSDNVVSVHFFTGVELRKGGDPKYAHLNMDLHVFIEVFGPLM